MGYRVIASVVTFLVGWTVFAITSPTEELRLSEHALQISSITLRSHGCSDPERTCPVFEATFRSDGRCSSGYITDDYIGKFSGEFNPQDFTYIVEQINKQAFFELPLAFPTTATLKTTSVEVVTNGAVRLVMTYNWASALPPDFTRCNLY